MTEAERERMQHLKAECGHAKRELIDVAYNMAKVSRREASRLEKIIARLEAFQNS